MQKKHPYLNPNIAGGLLIIFLLAILATGNASAQVELQLKTADNIQLTISPVEPQTTLCMNQRSRQNLLTKKVGGTLTDLYCGIERQGEGIRSLNLATTFQQNGTDFVQIDAVANTDTVSLQTSLEKLGGKNMTIRGQMISLSLPTTSIDNLARLSSLKLARPVMATTNVGSVTGQHVKALGVEDALAAGLDGTGLKVGILSDSFDCGDPSLATDEADDIASGDLPSGGVTVLEEESGCGSASDEGRGIAQQVHDIVPGADLAFHSAFNGEANFAQGVIDLANWGADVIVDDVGYFAAPMFQDGLVAQAVDTVKASGVAYFSSAGNSARQSYEATFVDSGANGVTGGPLHDFNPGAGADAFQSITIPANTSVTFVLQWDDPYFSVSGSPGSNTDLDIYLTNGSGSILLSSTDNNIGGDPVELLGIATGGSSFTGNIAIDLVSGSAPSFIKYYYTSSRITINEYATQSGTIYGHSNAAGAMSVGAAFYFDTPPYETDPAELESFSSAGGVPILFDTGGNPVTNPNDSRSPAQIDRNKPDIVGPDGTDTTFFGTLTRASSGLDGSGGPYLPSDGSPTDDPAAYNFFGTSSSAPNIAAIAAMMIDANPNITVDEIYACLENTAENMGSGGFDDDTGNGYVVGSAAISCAYGDDHGDLPDSYDTLLASGGPSHGVYEALRLGACVDSESNGDPSTDAQDDDSTSSTTTSGTCATAGDDEDGVAFTGLVSGGLALCSTASFGMSVTGVVPSDDSFSSTGSANGILSIWVDRDADGSFEAGEQLVTDNVVNSSIADADTLSFTAGTSTTENITNISFTLPCDMSLLNTSDGVGVRVRFARETGLGPGGSADSGEVEDYILPIYGWDFGDAPNSNSQTEISGTTGHLNNGSGARHLQTDTLTLGSCTDAETNGSAATSPSTPTGDDNSDTGVYTGSSGSCSNDEDGYTGTQPDNDWSDGSGSVQVAVSGVSGSSCLYGWIDWDNDGFSADGSSDSFASVAVSGNGNVTLAFTSGIPSSGSSPYMRLRLVPGSCQGSYNPDGYAIGGEVEDYQLAVTLAQYDYGDLPDSFDTTNSNGGPSHAISSDLYLGSCVDIDSDGQPDAQAGVDGSGGDDNNGVSGDATGSCSPTGDDEDGVKLVTPLIAGNQACVEIDAVNSTGGNATLYGWIDFNGDGDFDGDANEALTFTSGGTVANGGATNQQACFNVPSGATLHGGETHLRFRLTTDTLNGATPWGGAASDGEVEDYYQQFACVGNYVWSDLDGDGVQDGSESGLNGVGINLVWAGMNGTFGDSDDRTYTTTTATVSAVDGVYSFCGLLPDDSSGDGGDYRLEVPTLPSGVDLTVPNSGGNDLLDSDGTQPSGPGTAVRVASINIPNSVSLTTSENGSGDDPGNLNGYPDAQDDLSFDIAFAGWDYGDLPDGNGTGTSYPTTNTDGGEGAPARHTLNGTLFLGSCVDADSDGQPNATAAGDDSGGASRIDGAACADDENGVRPAPGSNWSDGTAELLVDVTGGDGCLNVWLDWGNGTTASTTGDGDFDAGDQVVSNLAVTTGTNIPVNFSLPADAANNATWYLRARLTPRDAGSSCTGANSYASGSPSPAGDAYGGEVEDYQIGFAALAVHLQRISASNGSNITVALWLAGLLLVTLGLLFVRWRRVYQNDGVTPPSHG